MSLQPRDPDFRGIIEEAAAGWVPHSQQLSAAPSAAASPGSSQIPPPSSAPELGRGLGIAYERSGWENNEVWLAVLHNLTPEFKSLPFPRHVLTESICRHQVLRDIEWNPYRKVGGFAPRTAHDFASVMIYLCGQVNPNPCRNCLLQNGPFERCILAPSAVLADASMRHACANCTYQKQFRKCNNDPISEQEMARSRSLRPVPRPDYDKPRMTANKRPYNASMADPTHERFKRSREQEPSSSRTQTGMPNTSSDPSSAPYSFSEKVQIAKKWSPAAKLKMKAELLQWKAALAAAEAEEMAESEGKQAHSSQSMASGRDLAVPVSDAALVTPQAPRHNYTPPSPFLERTPVATHHYSSTTDTAVNASGCGLLARSTVPSNDQNGAGSRTTSPSTQGHPHPRSLPLSLQTSEIRGGDREAGLWGSPAHSDQSSRQFDRMDQDGQASAGPEERTGNGNRVWMEIEDDEDERPFIKPPIN